MRLLLVGAIAIALAGCHASAAERFDDARAQAAYDRYRRPDLLVDALAIRPGSHVADIGAGNGYLTIPIVAKVGSDGRVLATDIDPVPLAELHSREDRIETRLVTSGDPGLGEERFDLILLAEVDHLLPNSKDYLARLRAHLRSHGRLAVSNRLWDKEHVRLAARGAGLVELGEFSGLPGHFLLFFGASR